MQQRPRDPCTEQAAKSHEAMLAEVLKGLGTVKLKKVEKSPSGTPLRKCGESESDTDPAGMLARALKKRFVHIHPPESSDDSAAEAWSPSSPDVQVKRRVGRPSSDPKHPDYVPSVFPDQAAGNVVPKMATFQCDKQKEALNQACTPAAHAPGPRDRLLGPDVKGNHTATVVKQIGKFLTTEWELK
ncbi:hypothetical protein HPB50_006224 [Hyalomma asiaticum]|uniref:Uncharacterized protein n=1 Tax=Hyalomma asiaticum TaxID=266040 RepID=A0ACB7RJB3_HYAAI|nr:hypothetical protein HPB50_006224 [Hyalomma asiaticum]